MKKHRKIHLILSLIIYIFISFQCSTSNKLIGYQLSSLTANFIITEQDTISFENSALFNYSILIDSIGRKFFVIEDGCNNSEINFSKYVAIEDTVFLTINLTDPNRFHPKRNKNYRGPSPISIIIGRDDGNHLEVYESKQLCNHQYLVFN